MSGEKLERRAIQIGISGNAVHNYVNKWIVQLEEVAELAKQIGESAREKRQLFPEAPAETEYQVDDELKRTLGITE